MGLAPSRSKSPAGSEWVSEVQLGNSAFARMDSAQPTFAQPCAKQSEAMALIEYDRKDVPMMAQLRLATAAGAEVAEAQCVEEAGPTHGGGPRYLDSA